MIIGKLNEKLTGASCRVTFASSTLVPQAKTSDNAAQTEPLRAEALPSNPLRGESLCYAWEIVRDEGIELHFSLGETVFVDRVSVRIGEKTALTSVVLKGSETTVLSAHRAETGCAITAREIELEADAVTDALSLVLTGDFSDIEILSVALYGCMGDSTHELSPVLPTPREMTVGSESLPAADFRSYSADSSDGTRAGEILAEKFAEIAGVQLQKTDADGFVRFSADQTVAPDGYTLSVTKNATTVRASNFRGFVMGAETLVKLIDRTRLTVPLCEIADAPFLPFRGVHLFLPSLANMDFARRLVKYLISPMGYNAVIVEIATGMRYESHPEINEAFAKASEKARAGIWPPFPHGSVADGTVLEKQDIRAFVAYVRSFGIEVIPEVQSLGHVPYLTLSHPEIAEVDQEEDARIDTRAEDARPDKFYPHCYCPSNEKSYALLFDILDEVIEVFEPREYVHMGHDEVYYMGLCPKCREKSHAELFASDVNRIYAHLREKGLKMMIWSDMLQPVTKYRTPPAADLISKDILCLDFIWYFHLDKDIETNLLDKGFTVAVGNLYSSHFPRYETRIRQNGMVGGQISAWVSTREDALQREGKLYDLLFTAEMLWSESYTHLCRRVYDRIIARLLPGIRESLKNIRYPSRIAGAERVLLLENETPLPPVKQTKQTVLVAVNTALDSLILTHTMTRRRTRLPWKKCETVGRYVLRYADGEVEEIPVTVGGNIAHWNRHQNDPLHPKLYRHNGYTATYECDAEELRTADGEKVTFYRLEHLLRRGTALLSVELIEEPDSGAGILLRQIEGVRIGLD